METEIESKFENPQQEDEMQRENEVRTVNQAYRSFAPEIIRIANEMAILSEQADKKDMKKYYYEISVTLTAMKEYLKEIIRQIPEDKRDIGRSFSDFDSFRSNIASQLEAFGLNHDSERKLPSRFLQI